MFSLPNSNEMVPVADLVALNKALRKAGNTSEVGYQTAAGLSGQPLSALVPQSIEGTLASATFTMKELVLWPAIPKRSVQQTLHEFTVIQEHGLDLDPWLAEGAGGINNKSEYSREFVKIKYLAERREVSDVASMVSLIGPNANAIAEETQRGTLRLLQKLERSLWHAKGETMNALSFDGIIKQIEDGASANVLDMRGATVDPQLLQGVLGQVYGAPNFGMPDTIYAEPRVHMELVKQSVTFGRHDQLTTGEGKITFGHRNLEIMAPYGAVPIKSAPFLFTHFDPPGTNSGHTGTAASPTDPTLVATGGATAVKAAAAAGSKFVAADAGFYWYKVVAVGDTGFSAAQETTEVDIAAGDSVNITVNDGTDKSTSGIRSYRVYRSPKTAASTAGNVDNCKFMAEFAVNGLGAGGTHTMITDLNEDIPGTSSMVMVQHSPDIMEFVRLLDFLRRPLAEVNTTKPFLLMLFGAPVIKVPSKCFLIKNVGTS